MAGNTRLSILTLIVVAGCLPCAVQAQIPVRDFQALEGPWECRNAVGIHGVFISALTNLIEKGGRKNMVSQGISIRVYERVGGIEHQGYFSPSHDGSTVLDGKHLIIHFKNRTDVPPFDLDVTFDPVAHRWVGSWSLCDKTQAVVLKRPHQARGIRSGPFVGDWEGVLDPAATFRSAPGTVHIRQGDDGVTTAWLDRTLSGYERLAQTTQVDQRNAEQLKVLSVTPRAIIFETANAFGVNYRYEGTLSDDGKSMIGGWHGGTGGTLNAPIFYRFIDGSASGD